MTVADTAGFDRAIRRDRALILRRRLIWFCLFCLLLKLTYLANLLFKAGPAGQSAGAWHNLLLHGPEILLCVAGATIAYLSGPAYSMLRLLAWSIVITIGAIDLIGIAISSNAQVGTNFAPAAWFSLAFRFGLASVFIPWSLGEAVITGGFLLLVLWAVTIVRMAAGNRDTNIFLLMSAAPFALLPGVGLRWWRYSRFYDYFHLRYVSSLYHDVQGELVSARRIHETCLPAPQLSGSVRFNYSYEPMREIGGDLLFAHISKDRPEILTLIIIDVMGHGIGAALTVNRLFGELERIFGEQPEFTPAAVLQALNRYVFLTLAKHGIYATAVCLKIDAAQAVVTWAGGGHPEPLLRRKDATIIPLPSQSAMLGIDANDAFIVQEDTLPFHAGDALVAYTDGAEEARNEAGRKIGKEGISSLIQTLSNNHPVEEWPTLMLREINMHREGMPQDDTLLVVAFVANAGKK
jgi:serine phosphatase RsbU (regulator of sigma subunit)